MYRTYNARPLPQSRVQRKRSKLPYVISMLSILLFAYIGYASYRPLPAPKITISSPVIPAMIKVNIPWPAAGQAAYGADGYGLLAQSTPASAAIKSTPTASVAKVITALAILEKKPLRLGDQGPNIVLSAADVELYAQYIAKDGSVVPVTAGQTITQYQALQALMLASANNIADSLAMWAFGSVEAYNVYANLYVKKLAMNQTTIADASGFSPSTVSTPADLVRLGDVAVDHPVLAEIMNQKTAIFPGAGPITNVNNLLGQSGIRGIKTGNTTEAGGCYLAIADVMIGTKKISVITAVMGAPDRTQAMRSSLPLIQSTTAQFQNIQIVRAGQTVGKVTTKWGSTSAVVATKAITVTAWTGTSVSPTISANKTTDNPKSGQTVGSLDLDFNDSILVSPLILVDTITKPSFAWRLTHLF